MNAKEILIAAKDKISNPEKWTQKEYARNIQGIRVLPRFKKAVCWCSLGALEAVCDINNWDNFYTAKDMLLKASKILFDKTPNEVNDICGHDKVMEMFDFAIQKAA